MSKPEPKKPLVIYIAEHNHGDMSYGSVAEKIIRDCQEKGLGVQIFSEFESQSQKIKWMKDFLTNEPSEEYLKKTTTFLDSQLLPMLPFDKRFAMEKAVLEDSSYKDSPMQAFDQLIDNVDNPEIFQLLKNYKKNWVKDNDEEGKKGVALLRNCFSYNQVHEKMANNIEDMLEPRTDVAIVVAGSYHIFGLDKRLKAFKDCQKIVVGNEPETIPASKEKLGRDGIETKEGREALKEIISHGGDSESLAQVVGKYVNFKIDPTSKEAFIPDAVKHTITERLSRNAYKKEVKAESPKPSSEPQKPHAEKMAEKNKDNTKKLL